MRTRIRTFSSAAYRCPIPLEASPGGQESSTSRPIDNQKAKKAVVPAWPDIIESDRWVTFPGLMRATFINRPELKFNELNQGVIRYIKEHGDVHELRGIIQAYSAFFASFVEQIDAETEPEDLDALRTFIGENNSEAYTLASDALGHTLGDIIGPEDTFSTIHEIAHERVGSSGILSAVLQQSQADLIHGVLQTLSQSTAISLNEVTQLWKLFFTENRKLVQLVQTFEPIEEIVANFYGLAFTESNIRESILDKVMGQIIAKGWEELFLIFAVEGCENDVHKAFALMELCTMLTHFAGFSPIKALNSALGGLSIGQISLSDIDGVDDSLSKLIPGLEPVCTALKAARRESMAYPSIRLLGSGEDNNIQVDIRIIVRQTTDTSETNMLATVEDKIAWESIRQQLSHPRRVERFTCAFYKEGLLCCGRAEVLSTLWSRLPEEYRQAIGPSVCGMNT